MNFILDEAFIEYEKLDILHIQLDKIQVNVHTS